MSSSIDNTILCSGIAAAFLTTCLLLAQNDAISRLILSPVRLRAKRRQENLYILEKAIAQSILFLRKYINGGSFYDWELEKKIMDLVLRDEDIETLVKEIVIVNPSSATNDQFHRTPLIVGIAKDLTLSKSHEWYLHLAFPTKIKNGHDINDDDPMNRHYGRRVQVPLEKFCQYLSIEFDKQKDKTNLCFIADASSSLGSYVLGQVIENCQCQIPVIHEPAWMFIMAFLIQKQALCRSSIEKVLYGLCKLCAQAVGDKIGSKYSTAVFTLPGQSSTATLLPVLQSIFPCEKHIFVYDGCFESVQRSIHLNRRSNVHYEVVKNKRMNSVYSLLETSMPRCISSAIPITPLNVKDFTAQTATLSHRVASITESWMSSIDTFLKLKNDEKISGYIPFVCKLGFIMEEGSFLGEEYKSSTISSMALKNILEYILGSKSNNFPHLEPNVLDAAEAMLKEIKFQENTQHGQNTRASLSNDLRVAIEDCVFLHKSILIGNKILPDTVQPKPTGWSLKTSTTLRGCACCFGMNDGSDDE